MKNILHRPLSLNLLVIVGFTPIAALAADIFNWMPLCLSCLFLVFPVTVALLLTCVINQSLGLKIAYTLLSGMIATGLYDLFRLIFILSGQWPDFIPIIGQHALNDANCEPVYGYLYRYIYDGGFMALAYMTLPFKKHTAHNGIAFGVFVCGCLFLTLLLAPNAQDNMFPLNLFTMTVAMTGHIIYGAVTGFLIGKFSIFCQPQRANLELLPQKSVI